jgi:hypothetical protein
MVEDTFGKWVSYEDVRKLEEEKLAYMEALSEEMIRNKQLRYELHISRSSAILLKHALDGGYD